MANFKYFVECNGQAVELTRVYHDYNKDTKRYGFVGTCTCGQKHIATRVIEYKAFARKHECDARCVNATGRVMKCECSCGGKNHGRGSSSLVLAA